MFDFSHPYWGDNPPFHMPVFVVTHRPAERIDKDGGTSYTFITEGLGAAIDRARVAAGGKDVLIACGLSIAQQALAESLVDELSMHIAPVLIGSGRAPARTRPPTRSSSPVWRVFPETARCTCATE